LLDALDQLQGQHAVGIREAALGGGGQRPFLRRPPGALGRHADAADQFGRLQFLHLLAGGFEGDGEQLGKVGGLERPAGLEQEQDAVGGAVRIYGGRGHGALETGRE